MKRGRSYKTLRRVPEASQEFWQLFQGLTSMHVPFGLFNCIGLALSYQSAWHCTSYVHPLRGEAWLSEDHTPTRILSGLALRLQHCRCARTRKQALDHSVDDSFTRNYEKTRPIGYRCRQFCSLGRKDFTLVPLLRDRARHLAVL